MTDHHPMTASFSRNLPVGVCFSISIPWSNRFQRSTAMIQRQCISHSNASRSICTSLGSLCGSRQQGLKFSCFPNVFHILHGETANCDEASQLAIWLHNSREAEWSILVEVWVSQGVGQWWYDFQLSPRQPQKVSFWRFWYKLSKLSIPRNAGRWAMKSLHLKMMIQTHSQYLNMPADSVILDLQYSGCLVIIASLCNRPLSQISGLGLRVSCICVSSNFPCTNPFHIGILPPSSPQTFCRFTKGLVEACWWPTSQVAWLQHPNSSRWSVQDGDHRKELR